MEHTVTELIGRSNKHYKLMKDIPNELKFSSNKNISGYKFKPILVTSENVRKENKSRAVHAAGLS